MEIFTTLINGATVNVIFTGSHYYFHNSFFGIIGVAKRLSDSSEMQRKRFELLTGNNHTEGALTDCTIVSMMKRVINRAENKYVPCDVEYDIKSFRGWVSMDINHVEHL